VSLFGSRATLIANLCALAVASTVIAEGAYIVHERMGYYRPQDAWGFLFPALVMFIIRSRIFSFFFLALYVALSIQMFLQARSIYLGTYEHAVEKGGPLGYLPLFFFVSMACLAIYVAVASIRVAISKFTSAK